jgi:pilus assembly protein CpaF
MSTNSALLTRVRERLVEDGSVVTPARVAEAVRREGGWLDGAAVLDLVGRVTDDMVGAGPLESWVRLEGVTDVLVNGADSVWIDRGNGLEDVPSPFDSDADVDRLARRLAAIAGRRLDIAAPFVDARLPDGVRVHAGLAPVCGGRTLISLRVPSRRVLTLEDLVERQSISRAGAQWLEAIISARLSFVLSGGTGVGKTTVLSALLSLVTASQRIVLVEDTAELRPDHPHVVAMESRPANSEGAGAVVLRDLVRQALRMRPDRLVVGEVRGAEVVDLLAALNTGHEGGCCTVHANSAADVPARLEALAVAAGLSREAVHSQLAAGLDCVVHLARDRSGRRRAESLSVLTRGDDGFVRAQSAVAFGADGSVTGGPGEQVLRARIAASS